jgi:asparagine synthase (glutamine-hydrolysing)
MCRLLISLFDDDELKALYRSGGAPARGQAAAPEPASRDGRGAFLDEALLLQFESWLPDNILARQDKMSMAHSVEARVPFLDHVLVEFLLSVPRHLKLGPAGGNKVLERRHAARRLPAHVARQRKKAFHVPPERYLDAPVFQELVGRTLRPELVTRRGYFDPDAVQSLLRVAQATREFVPVKQVFALMMLELWHQIFIDGTSWA